LVRNPRGATNGDGSYKHEDLFARVKLPTGLLRLHGASSSTDLRFIPIRDIIERFIGTLYPGMEILSTMNFSVTRNSEVQRDEEESDDLLRLISEELRERRFAKIIRLEHGPAPISVLRDFLKNELELGEDDIYLNEAEVDFSDLGLVADLNRADLRFRPWRPRTPAALLDNDVSMFSAIREQDLLVHHPYDSFHHTVERFIRNAVEDPRVLAIKMVVYRIGAKSPFIPLLMRAAESGKNVVCIVEIKARFDEEQNIEVAKALEKSGVHVVYGVVGLKTHCKLALVIRDEGDDVRSYVHLGTGNYNPATSTLFSDFGLFTSKPEITREVMHIFHYLTGRSLFQGYKQLIVSPLQMRSRFVELIHAEKTAAAQGRPAWIIAKMNSLEDRDMIEELYSASAAGVRIDLIVRGVCCLKPGVPGLSENIRVVSIVGRFLEHARIYYFQNGAAEPNGGLFLLGSADWMRRNLSYRVEALATIDDPNIRAQLWHCLQTNLSDQKQGWVLTQDGTASRADSVTDDLGTHESFLRMYEAFDQKRPLVRMR
jgi:polyphosphate kinase